ncbi:MAG: NAD(P)H-binding protein [Gemmatimonadetes bacterium]|nr:NAD(P)H-binding protein [Gemmatimonadota bacterium]NNM07362.1 NAD(P)H-binding protein [Gemmatimonadota bacterium]
MSNRVLVLGATGTLGKPVVRSLAERGHAVCVTARSAEKARQIFGDTVEVLQGDSTDREHLRKALVGCEAVHVSLPTEAELIAVRHVIDLTSSEGLQRISYVSGTSAREENRWFEIIDVKLKAEALLRSSGIPCTIFCPTWVMEVLPNFFKGDRAVVIVGKNPPGFHFFAAADFGRMVANSYADGRALGRRLFIHGPESITLPQALRTYHAACHPQLKVTQLKLFQARLVAKITRQKRMESVTRLIAYFDKTEEGGDPSEADSLLGAPSTTLGEWMRIQKRQS